MTPRLIRLHGESVAAIDPRIWAAMERLVPVKFLTSEASPDSETVDAFIFLGREGNLSKINSCGAKRCMVIASSLSDFPEEVRGGEIRFGNFPSLDYRLRGRTLSHDPVKKISSFTLEEGDIVYAEYGLRPVWIRRRSAVAVVEFLTVPLPSLKNGEFPFDYLNGSHFIQLLPLVHFLRDVVGVLDWQPQPLRACLMFDDPNLHWTSYGFLPFRETAALAEETNFHVACATVPLDGWFVHSPTANIFRCNSRRLSLLMHGNDHIREELGVPRDVDSDRMLVSQALHRVARLEGRAKIRVARVMAPPHGASRPQILRAMFDLGLEGACISPWSLRHWGAGRNWPASFGLEVAELMDGPFPVAPRFKMTAGCEGWVAISAFLNRPIVPVGHHDAVAEGIDLLREIADTVNSLGRVDWGDMESIFRSSFLTRRQGATIVVRPYCCRFSIAVPDGITTIELDRRDSCDSLWQVVSGERTEVVGGSAEGNAVSVVGGLTVEFQLLGWAVVDYREVASPSVSMWALPRSILCELRDRVRPLLATR